MGWFSKLFNRNNINGSQACDASRLFDKLNWIERNNNEFGLRLLDCRPIAQTFLSVTENKDAIHFFQSPESKSGKEFLGKHPEEMMIVTCNLEYTLESPLKEGPLFLADTMEDKWNIYYHGSALYFVRSWTGQLHYVTNIELQSNKFKIVSIEAWPGNVIGPADMTIRQINYLIQSHIFGKIIPHPVPQLPSKEGMALWSFAQYGRRGLFAAPEASEVQ